MIIPSNDVPLRSSGVSLDISGVAGFFGGDVAVSAMGTVHIYEGRRWLGWYNMPGSYEIAKRYGQLAKSRFWSGLYPGFNTDAATLFGFDGISAGPKYRGIHSGTIISRAGHVAHLFLEECKKVKPTEGWKPPAEVRTTFPVDVTIAHLNHEPSGDLHPREGGLSQTSLLSIIPILASAAATIACAAVGDWPAMAMIILGMVSGGVSCLIIGSGDLTFKYPTPADGAPRGDGILYGTQIAILQGTEHAITPITRGRFTLEYKSKPKYHDIGISSLLLTAQFLVQLLVVPQGKIFGQVMFLSSLGVSWVYNSYLSSLDKEDIQRRLLRKQVLKLNRKENMMKFTLGTRTASVVFVLLVLSMSSSSGKVVERQALQDILDDLLPNNTAVWRSWKEAILGEVCKHSASPGTLPVFARTAKQEAEFKHINADYRLLNTFYLDARAALAAYEKYRELRNGATEPSPEKRYSSESDIVKVEVA